MTLSIIAQFQDRASRGLKTLMRLGHQHERMQKAHGRASQDAARAQARLARASGEAGRAMGRESAAASRLHAALARVNAMIRKQASLRERLRRAGSLAREGGGRIGRAGAMAAGIYASVQATAASAASLVVGPAAQVEKYQLILETVLGSAQKARKALDWVTTFAVKTPYELEQVMEAFVKLNSYGLDPTNGLLKTLGDTAAAMGKPLMQAVEAIADAVTGENERLKEFGIKARAQGKYFYYEYTENGVTKVAKALKSNRAQIQQVLSDIFNRKYAGAMEKLSRSWEGMMSNLSDMWFKFRLMVAHSGVFDFLKDKLRFVLDELNRLEAAGKLQKLAQQMGASIIQGLKALWQFGLGVWAVLQKVGAVLSWAAEKLGGWNNLAMVLMALPLVNVLASFVSGLMLLGQAMMMIMPIFAMLKAAAVALSPALALLATPAGMVVAGIAAIGAAIAGVIWYFDLWPAIVSTVSAAWEGLKQAGNALVSFFSALPGRISAAWQAFKQWLAQPFDPFPGLRQRVHAVITMLTALPQQAMAAISQVMAAIRGLDIGALINPVNWPGLIVQGLQTAIARVRQAFAGLDLSEAGKQAMRTLWNGMKQVAGGLLSWAKGLAGKIGSAFSAAISWTKNLAAKAGRAVGAMFGGSRQTAAQPQARAAGGPFSRGPLLVGERGPELVYASRAGWVAHNDNLRRLRDLAQRTAASLAAVGMAGHIAAGSAALAQPQIAPISPSPAAIAAQPARSGLPAGSGETRIEVRYAPQITVHGNADAGQIRQALDAHLDDLLEQLERRQRERARLDF